MEEEMAYICTQSCGCVTAAMIADLETTLSVQNIMDSVKDLESWKEWGEVTLVNWEKSKHLFKQCKCKPKTEETIEDKNNATK